MITLAIDTSNKTMTIAVVNDSELLGCITTTVKKNHSETLMISIESLMQSIDLKPSNLQRIVVAEGPGSYTGLRIGATVAKILAWTLSIPLVGVSSLAALAYNLNEKESSGSYIVPLFNARRKNIYTGVYQWIDGKFSTVIQDQHVSLDDFLCKLKLLDSPLIFIGTDCSLFESDIRSVIPKTCVIIGDDRFNQPNGLTLSLLGDKTTPIDDVNCFVPNYLKRVEAEEVWLEKNDQREDGWRNHLVSFEGL